MFTRTSSYCTSTTAAIALATAASRAGAGVVRVYDADEQASASNWADYAERGGDPLPFEVLEGGNYVRLRRVASRERGLLVVDCPPARSEVTDKARDVADLVVVPTTPKPADVEKTLELVSDLEARGRCYAVLLNRVVARTVALREALGNFFGQALGDDLFGFAGVWAEIERMGGDLAWR